jgi:hypothetical protein
MRRRKFIGLLGSAVAAGRLERRRSEQIRAGDQSQDSQDSRTHVPTSMQLLADEVIE